MTVRTRSVTGAHPRRVARGEGHFRRYLAGQKLKMTGERRLILAEALGSKEHFGADELHLRFVGKRIPMSRATIYRALGPSSRAACCAGSISIERRLPTSPSTDADTTST